jgi:hypothetical protein
MTLSDSTLFGRIALGFVLGAVGLFTATDLPFDPQALAMMLA